MAANPTVLLVDDEEMILTSIRTLLMLEADYDIHCFTNPKDAVQHLEHNPVDITVSDYLMPGLTGIQLLAEAKRLQLEFKPDPGDDRFILEEEGLKVNPHLSPGPSRQKPKGFL